MKKLLVLALVVCSALLEAGESRTVYRDAQGRATGSESKVTRSDGTTAYTYRDAQGRTTGTATERTDRNGTTHKVYRDAQGRTTGKSETRARK